jgi:hypothetical protein
MPCETVICDCDGVYHSALAATNTVVVLSAETSLEQVGEWAKEMRIYSICPDETTKDL